MAWKPTTRDGQQESLDGPDDQAIGLVEEDRGGGVAVVFVLGVAEPALDDGIDSLG